MIRGLFRFIFATLRLFVRTLDFVVRGLFYAMLVFGVGMIVAFFFRPEPDIPAGSALLLRPGGAIVEQAVFDGPLDLLGSGGTPAGQNVLADLLEAVRLARDDARISALVIETDQLLAGGFSKLGKLAPEAIDAHANDYRDALAAAGGDGALAARNAGLVDRFSTRDEWRARLIERVGTKSHNGDPRMVDVDRYLAVARSKQPQHGEQVAVLVAQGAIVDGREPAGVVGGDTFAELIRAVRNDGQVKALVLRIDSPGGSAWASEVIRRELELTRKAGKPVIASMSSVAASGGYWIAAGADEIWAAPATLTGSIGIFAMFPEFSEPLQRLGINIDGVATAPLAGALDPRRPLSPAAAEAMQLGIEHGYRRFIDVVAKARDMKQGEVETVARGRVWLGAAASELGLVDQTGGLEAAVAAAAARAGLENYDVVWPEAGQSLQERLLRRLAGFAGQFGIELPQAAPSPLLRLLAEAQAPAAALLQWNDPQHQYLHCLCEAP